jgi:hypothetical protein
MANIKFRGNSGDLETSFPITGTKHAVRKKLKDATDAELKWYIDSLMANPKNFKFLLNVCFESTYDELKEFSESQQAEPRKINKPKKETE